MNVVYEIMLVVSIALIVLGFISLIIHIGRE
jgi:hypothetical protein